MRPRIIPLLFIVGVFLLIIGIADYNQEAGAKPEPDVITAADLVAKGAPENVHLRITDAVPGFDESVKLTSGRARTVDLFVPLLTMPARFNEKPELAAIARMKEEDFSEFRGGPVQGMRIKGSLNSSVADRLATTYGKAAVDKALFLQYKRKPAGLALAFSLMGGGVLAIAVGIIMKRRGPAAAPPLAVPPAPYPPAGSLPPPPPPR